MRGYLWTKCHPSTIPNPSNVTPLLQQSKTENLPLNKGQHSHTRPGPRFEYCAYENSRKTSGIANTIINITYGTRKAPV